VTRTGWSIGVATWCDILNKQSHRVAGIARCRISHRVAESEYWNLGVPLTQPRRCDAYVQGLVVLNVKNPVGHGVKTDGTTLQTWKSLTDHFDAVINSENRLCAIKYADGSNLNAHFAALCIAWEKVNNQGGSMTDAQFHMIVLRSMPKSWNTLISTLMSTKMLNKVIVQLMLHGQLLAYNASPVVTPSQSTHALATQTQSHSHQCSTDVCTNPVCGHTGHTLDRCFKLDGEMAGQYLAWWGKCSGGSSSNSSTGVTTIPNATATANSAIIATPTPTTISSPAQYYAFMASISDMGPSGVVVSYADSVASDHCFVRREDFTTYTPCIDRQGATATNGTFAVLGIGSVNKSVIFNGHHVELTFKNAIHTPALTHNLIPIG